MFDEVLKIIEDEGINIEGLFLGAFERLNEAHIANEDVNQSNSKTHETLDSQLTDVNLVDYSDDMGGDPNIKEIDQNRYDFDGPGGDMKNNLKLNLEQIEAQKNK